MWTDEVPQYHLKMETPSGVVWMWVCGGGGQRLEIALVIRAVAYGVGLNPPPGVYWRLKPPFAPKHGPPVPPLVQFVRML